MSNQPIIIVDHLTKQFKTAAEPSVRGISLIVKENEIFGLLGPNGAGKTTTISMLCGLFPPSSGNITINGFNLQKDGDAVKQIIGVVPQDIALYPTLTGRENLQFFGQMYGVKGKELNTKVDNWLEKLGLSAKANRKVSEYSGGMKRRINLIAGILHSPKVLFLDEPTVGVDVQSRTVIIERLKELNAEGTTIIYTSHHMEEAEHFCTRVSIIDQGKILAENEPKALINTYPGSKNLEDVFLHLTKRKLRD